MGASDATTLSEELAAMDKVAAALASLDGCAAERVIRWAASRFAVMLGP